MSGPHTQPSPSERADDIPRIEQALRQAVQDALRLHRLHGNSVAVWRNGRVEWVPPEQIPVEESGRHERQP